MLIKYVYVISCWSPHPYIGKENVKGMGTPWKMVQEYSAQFFEASARDFIHAAIMGEEDVISLPVGKVPVNR